jgi:cell wall assembly regulator SMI1
VTPALRSRTAAGPLASWLTTLAAVAASGILWTCLAADPNRTGKVIYILSDGDFSGMFAGSVYAGPDGKRLTGNDAVIQFLRDHNPDKAVQVNTILLFSQDEDAIKVFKQIAAENAGQFKHVSQDD